MSVWHGPSMVSGSVRMGPFGPKITVGSFSSGCPLRAGEVWRHQDGYEFLIHGQNDGAHAFVNMRTGEESQLSELALLVGRDFVRLA